MPSNNVMEPIKLVVKLVRQAATTPGTALTFAECLRERPQGLRPRANDRRPTPLSPRHSRGVRQTVERATRRQPLRFPGGTANAGDRYPPVLASLSGERACSCPGCITAPGYRHGRPADPVTCAAVTTGGWVKYARLRIADTGFFAACDRHFPSPANRRINTVPCRFV